MKLYGSLIYREIKIVRKHYLFALLVVVIISAVMLMPVIKSPSDNITLYFYFMSPLYSIFGGPLALSYSNIHREDKASGWKSYYYTLPITPRQKALTNLLVKLIFTAIIAVIVDAFALTGTIITGSSITLPVMNIYFTFAAFATVFDILFNVLPMMPKKENTKIALLLVAIGLLAFGFICIKAMFRNADKYKLIDALFNSLLSAGMLIKALIAFASVCVLHYMAMKEIYRSREH